MKIDSATIDIRARSIGEVVDVAFLFYRTHFFKIAPLMWVGAIPAVALCLTIVWITRVPWMGIGVVALGLFPASGGVVAAAGELVFGRSLTMERVGKRYRKEMVFFWGRRILENGISLVLMPVVVGYVLKLNWGFSPMVCLLEHLKGKERRQRLKGLSRGGDTNLLGADLLLVLVVFGCVIGVGAVLEVMTGQVFTVWVDSGLFSVEAFYDPIRLLVWIGVWISVYPLYVLGWFFLYLDARTRKEGWDLELVFRAAAKRLEKGRSL